MASQSATNSNRSLIITIIVCFISFGVLFHFTMSSWRDATIAQISLMNDKLDMVIENYDRKFQQNEKDMILYDLNRLD